MHIRINPGHQVTYQGVIFTAGQAMRNVSPAVAQDWISQGIAAAYTPPRTAENTFEDWYR
ncbi:hypothetical protein ACFYPZ_30345 [Streptomyces sp. NPDC005506]|uniref:hypothetical protein n=1 Tax=unclassified Streptomyces TaxID=2593676 RepID=UPI00368660B5